MWYIVEMWYIELVEMLSNVPDPATLPVHFLFSPSTATCPSAIIFRTFSQKRVPPDYRFHKVIRNSPLNSRRKMLMSLKASAWKGKIVGELTVPLSSVMLLKLQLSGDGAYGTGKNVPVVKNRFSTVWCPKNQKLLIQ
jgi:hypothetical protein